ncbi:hypothetical protein [Dactylosporangium sp. NPDC049140]|uniref:hypothetical protein n=1 Tax=Dactylosporangium sp. NPDC049140 TaxID=3155647 RepID=UPI0033EC6BF8
MTLPPPPGPFGYPGAPPPQPKSNTGLIIGVIGGLLALCLVGVCVAGVGFFYFKDKSHSEAEGQSPVSVATRDPYPTDTYTAPAVVPTTRAAPPPAPVSVGDCIALDSVGTFEGRGNCNGSSGTYRVLSVDYSGHTCSDPESPYITESGYRLCLELYLVRNYCYQFPSGPGWVVAASACKAKGTVHIVDIVPGGTNGNNCTRDYKWNRWYSFTHPTVVYCVMQY